ncbi:YceI family protein [Flavobacterium amniphilum]|uniref:YceI family protein n=1 Tax=Flavobacterium amniphilum TaxID=1834035 RepID=UPI00202A9199|nr:YceI family protein [Flavobacterium amniphilum]MCL9806980.1 YceI family protein [Flavobacterium amniphilum]
MEKSNWVIDPTHSEIGFKVKHMMFTNVSGKFNAFDARIENENNDFTSSKIVFNTQVSSIDTNSTDRDNHLKSVDFFDVDNFPKISFISTEITRINDSKFIIKGDLTIKGVTKNIQLHTEYSGLMTDPWNNTKLGISVSGEINRKDFGLTWNAALETGGLLVGEEIKLISEIQFIKQ